MQNRTVTIAAVALLLAGTLETAATQQSAAKPPQEFKVNIDTRQTAQPVSPYEYGMFIEHIGSGPRC
jgi:alpha-N-arabinofuranosidase